MFASRARKRAGVTLLKSIALLIALGSVTGVAVPIVLSARRAADRQTTMDNLGHCTKAVHLANDAFHTYPPYFGPYGDKKDSPLTFHAHLLPFLSKFELYINLEPDAAVPTYLAPLDPTVTDSGAGAVNFPVNLRLFYTAGGLGNLANPLIYPKMPGSFPGGVSGTLLFSTNYMHCGNGGPRWLDPGNNTIDSITAATFGANTGLWQPAPTRDACDPKAGTPVSFKRDGIYIATCDASVRFLSNSITASTWKDLHLPGRRPEGPDWEGN